MKIEIRLEHWDHVCADGCCYSYGSDVFINDVKIGYIYGDDAKELSELINEHINKILKEEALKLADEAYEAGMLHRELSNMFDDPKGRFLNSVKQEYEKDKI